MDQTPAKAQLVVIGAGPGGYAAAFQAADMNYDVTLVNADSQPGGVCLHRGCIPSKALLHAAKIINEAEEAVDIGLSFSKPALDIDKLRNWKKGILDRLASGVSGLALKRKVPIISARASFLNSTTLGLEPVPGIELKHDQISFEHAIVATGSSPAIPGPLRVDDPRIMDSTGALELEDIPEKLLVVGGGYIGLELGQVYAALGSKVTVVELTDGLLPGADRDLVRPLERRLAKKFDSMLLNTKVESLTPEEGGIVATLKGKETTTEQFDRVLISVGRVPNTRNMGLENTAVRIDERGFIEVNSRLQTADPNILAIGDVAGEPMLAHKAAHEGKIAVEALAGEPAEFDKLAIPAVVFTDPEIAWAGLTENQAKAQGVEFKVAKFPWPVSGRALTLGRTDGLTKLLFDPGTERLLGVGLVGAGAGELIAEGVVAIEMGAVARDLALSIHPHPTLSETIGEAAEAFLGFATHLYDPKRK